MSVNLDLAAAFFANARINLHAVGLFAKTPPLMEQLCERANSYWDLIWWEETFAQRIAREAIGNFRFFHPEAVQAYTGLPFGEKALVTLGNVPFAPGMLENFSNGDYKLIADPGLSILEMKKLVPGEFFATQHRYEGWEGAARRDPPSWMLLSTAMPFRSLAFAEQDRKRQDEGSLLLPSARRMVFGALALRLCEGTKYFFNAFIRTSDTITAWNPHNARHEKRRVTVGYDVHGVDVGICIDTWEDHVSGDRIGIGIEVDPKEPVL